MSGSSLARSCMSLTRPPEPRVLSRWPLGRLPLTAYRPCRAVPGVSPFPPTTSLVSAATRRIGVALPTRRVEPTHPPLPGPPARVPKATPPWSVCRCIAQPERVGLRIFRRPGAPSSSFFPRKPAPPSDGPARSLARSSESPITTEASSSGPDHPRSLVRRQLFSVSTVTRDAARGDEARR